jgi:hypothetical protein
MGRASSNVLLALTISHAPILGLKRV